MQALARADTTSKQQSRAIELLTSRLTGFENKGQLIIKALLPNFPNLIRPFTRPSPNIIRIVLDTKQNNYYPGDQISDIIRLILAEPISLKHISITLEGKAFVKLYHSTAENPRAIYISDVRFLQTSIDITAERIVLSPKRYEWPFSITLPANCATEQLQFNESTRLFDPDLSQPLPPTFHDNVPGATRNRCAIQYQLDAFVVQNQEN